MSNFVKQCFEYDTIHDIWTGIHQMLNYKKCYFKGKLDKKIEILYVVSCLKTKTIHFWLK